MRALTYVLVVLSVALSTGGVAIRSSADPASPGAVTQSPGTPGESAAQNAEDVAPKICRPPQPASAVTTLPIKSLPEGSHAVQLNTRGYNYQRPGDAPSFVPKPEPSEGPKSPPAAPKN